jgi:hypothetical protein
LHTRLRSHFSTGSIVPETTERIPTTPIARPSVRIDHGEVMAAFLDHYEGCLLRRHITRADPAFASLIFWGTSPSVSDGSAATNVVITSPTETVEVFVIAHSFLQKLECPVDVAGANP